MSHMLTARRFPCPICSMPQDVRGSKKGKPYITCNTCGVQVFIRGKVGIAEFNKLLERARLEGSLARMNEVLHRYHVRCATCGAQFWIKPESIVTSVFDGSLKGVRCPNTECNAVLPWKQVA
jgi:DNA-directed RNA polymerase subunit RPC12/RpoP